jgi:alpha-beta hydrolase superfamily lysophospholipase
MLEHSSHKIHQVVLFGHSAGGQLLSRVCAYTPLTDVDSVIIANPSSYVMPLADEPAPYGFGNIFSLQNIELKIKQYLSAPMTIYLGMEDVDTLNLSRTKASMRQGENRLARGRKTYKIGQQIARAHRLKINWRLVEIPEVGHSSREMLTSDNFLQALV